jgi:hypothetical protein
MPELDRELTVAGYVPILPSTVMEASVSRGPAFVDSFMALAKLSMGAFYIKQEDLDTIRKEYPSPIPTSTEVTTSIPPRVEYPDEIRQFLDLDQPCPKPEWEEAREEYRKEVEEGVAAKCTACKLNAIRNKYRKALEE